MLSPAPSRTTDQSAAQLPTSEQPAITVTPDNPNPLPSTATPTTVSPATPRVRAKSKLAIRGGPGTEYDLLGHLPAGTSAEVIGRDETEQWWKIKSSLTATGVAWVQADSNSVEVTNTENVPIALAPQPPVPPTLHLTIHSHSLRLCPRHPIPPHHSPPPTSTTRP
ncbi:MAG: SH3 domain-containing protein, partial [Anaerolineales bacterium]|nr:SH3 domain-containing protein [Anaerolineales bacterium]